MQRDTLDPIPTVADLAAEPITHHHDDMVAPCGLTNFLGSVRVESDITAISGCNFPPVAQGLSATAQLFVDGVLFRALPTPVTVEWRPDRVVRTAVLDDGVELRSTTICVPGHPAVLLELTVTNTGARPAAHELALTLGAGVTNTGRAWLAAEPPYADNLARVADGALLCHDPDSAAWSVQSVVGVPARMRGARATETAIPHGMGGNPSAATVTVPVQLAAGESTTVHYVHVVATTEDDAVAAHQAIAADAPRILQRQQAWWDSQLAAVFTPGNTEFSGHLPQLHTTFPELRTLYWWGAIGVLWFRRDSPASVLGRTYDTLMPNYWQTTTFIWDYSLSGLVHSLLDPDCMRTLLDHWIASDIHTHFGTEYVTGGPVGNWYSVNDYAMTRMVNDYVAHNGADYLDTEVTGRRVTDHLREWATAWRELRPEGQPLADYGEIDNLLECVGSYVHGVASLNAANVWCLRTAARLLDGRGDAAGSRELLDLAAELLPAVVELGRDDGTFDALQPDGSRVPVRHCYDFAVVGTTIADDLSDERRRAMVRFFTEELQTPTWMRALSRSDLDAGFSVRPDHQWNGAYTAWPADALRALVELGAPEVALDWIPGLTRSMSQGPLAQAHFTEDAQPPIAGGARKAPPQLPYIIDWACSSIGAYAGVVIESLFGVRVTADGDVRAGGPIADLDPHARLTGLRVGDSTWTVNADGTTTRE